MSAQCARKRREREVAREGTCKTWEDVMDVEVFDTYAMYALVAGCQVPGTYVRLTDASKGYATCSTQPGGD